MRRAPSHQHKTEEVVLKKAEIDKQIIPLIEWLNAFKGVATQFCCEGTTRKEIDTGKGQEYGSYVLFTCSDNWSLLQIMQKFTNFANLCKARCEVEFRPEYGYPIRYDMRFQTKEVLRHFLKYLETGRLEPMRQTAKEKAELIAMTERSLEELKAM